MNTLGPALIVGSILIAVATFWFCAVGFRVRWWWVPLFFLVLPVFIFAVIHRRALKVPGLLLVTAVTILFVGLIADGDLIRDGHPDEPPTRTFSQRAFGCSGAALWRELLAIQSRPLEDLLREFRLDAVAPDTEIGIALIAVHASALSYLLPAQIDTVSPLVAPGARTTVMTANPYQAVVLATDRLVVVAFRGTDSPKNWVGNFKFIPAATDLGWVHAGFRDGYRALGSQMMKTISAVRDKNQAIWLTGHSLGGAMAMLAAADLHTAKQDAAGVVTFGQPPAGYPAFAAAWEAMAPQRLVRYVNHVDTVVGVGGLIAWPSTQLTHTGLVRYFDTTGRLHHGSVPRLQLVRDAVCAPSFESGAEFGAHYIRRYVALVRHAAGSAARS